MALPNITLIGNLVADPELRHTQAGKPVVTLRVACNDRKKNDAGEWVDGESVFLDVTSWRSPEAINTQLSKGSKVLIVGTLRQDNYEKDGQKRTSYKVIADEIASLIYDRNGQISGSTSITSDPWATPADSSEAPF